jgi:hypothetical protein
MEREPHEHECATPRPRTLTADYRYAYRGYHADGGVCRVRLFEGTGQVPVVLVSELAENTSTSVTNMAEYLAAELIARHFPARFEAEDPAVHWVEHYPRTDAERRRGMPEYALVAFDSYRPRRVPRFGQDRVAIGRPRWTHVDRAAVERLLGQPLAQTEGVLPPSAEPPGPPRATDH